MSLDILAQKALKDGISKEDALALSGMEIEKLREAADKMRRELCGNDFDLCAIINAKSGRCSEDCKYCAQSAHYETSAEFYDLLSEEAILLEALKNERGGARRFSIVTSGRRLTDEEVETLCGIYQKIKNECGISLCASHGLLTKEQFFMLKEAGVERYHCNLETSRTYFPKVCTTHTFDDKVAAIKMAQQVGFTVCSGGIIGMGETMEDRIDLAFALRGLHIKSVPLNLLNPVRGTPFGVLPVLEEAEAERTAAVFRFILPDAQIRLAGGRINLKDRGKRMLCSGINAAISGDMLTTAGITLATDRKMIDECGFTVNIQK